MLFGKRKKEDSERGIKIVAADDERDIRTILKRGLATEGHTVILATNGQEALEKIRSEKPDLVILDIMMPKMDGIEALQKIKNDPRTKDLPVIMLTGKSEDEDLLKGYKFGADYYITKPFKIRTLLSGIRMMIQPPSGPTPYRI